jgi:hypothetical protein
MKNEKNQKLTTTFVLRNSSFVCLGQICRPKMESLDICKENNLRMNELEQKFISLQREYQIIHNDRNGLKGKIKVFYGFFLFLFLIFFFF